MRLIEKTHENESKYKSSQCNRPYPVCNRGVFPRSIDDERQLRQLVLNSSTIGGCRRQFPCYSHQSQEREIAPKRQCCLCFRKVLPKSCLCIRKISPQSLEQAKILRHILTTSWISAAQTITFHSERIGFWG